MRETRSRTNSGPRRFIGGAVQFTNKTPPSSRTVSVSKIEGMAISNSGTAIELVVQKDLQWCGRLRVIQEPGLCTTRTGPNREVLYRRTAEQAVAPHQRARAAPDVRTERRSIPR